MNAKRKATVVHLPVATRGAVVDPVFFKKEDVIVGTRFRYWGASGHSEWVVTDIVTTIRDAGHFREESVQHIRVLGDVIHIRRVDAQRPGNQVRHVSFMYLRYSAIWRIDV